MRDATLVISGRGFTCVGLGVYICPVARCGLEGGDPPRVDKPDGPVGVERGVGRAFFRGDCDHPPDCGGWCVVGPDTIGGECGEGAFVPVVGQ